MNPEFWRGRRVFVTGHSGFFGGWLCLWLARLGAEVTGFSLAPPTRPNLFDAIGLADDVWSITGDVRKSNVLSAAMRECNPELVFHLAAQPLVRQAHAAPVDTFSTNVMGTVNLLQAMRSCDGIDAAIVFTTDKVYENLETGVGYAEDDRLGGREPYGASKACAEIVTNAYRQSYFAGGPPVATVRAGNIVGGGDWSSDRLVPDAVRAFGAGRTLRIRNPHAVRPWQHALDPARGLLMLAERLVGDAEAPLALNFGPPDSAAAPVGPVVDTLTRLWGNGAAWASDADGNAPYEAQLLNLDSSLARQTIGWAPAWSLERALKATVEWYQAFLAHKDVRELSLSQIAAMEGAN
ncbi:MAG: CDP-glucose 4,6-dehydratase [Rhodospirillaceae bacterium]